MVLGAGSIIAYAIEITDIDPIKYGLLFERFLNPERISMPDFDVDFCYEKRQDVIDYVSNKYGYDHVSQIITFGTMAAKMVIRDVARVLDVPYSEANDLAKMIPNELHITIKKALEENRELRERYETEEMVKKVLDIAMGLEGMPRQASTHACRSCYYKRPSRYVCTVICKRWTNINSIYNDNFRGIRSIKNGLFRTKNINRNSRHH